MIDYWRDECLELTSHEGNQLFGEFIQVGCPIDDAERVLIYREDLVHDCEETIAAYINDLSSNDTLEKVYFSVSFSLYLSVCLFLRQFSVSPSLVFVFLS